MRTTAPADIDLKGPEWQAFTRPGPIDLPDFTTRKEPPPAKVRTWLPDVVLVPRLREVSALYGFTRIDSPEWDSPVHRQRPHRPDRARGAVLGSVRADPR